MEKYIELEANMNLCAALTEILKAYCEYNYDKSEELTILAHILNITNNKIHESIDLLEYVALSDKANCA